LHERLPVHRAVTAHAAVGRALAVGHAGRTDDIAGRLAEHFVASNDHRRAVEYLRIVGERSERRSAFGAATTALLDALDHLHHLPTGPDRDQAELRVRLALGPALVATRGWYGAEVAENYERALALCGASPCAEAAFARYGLATVTELRGEYERTEQLLTPLIPDGADMNVEAKELMACSAFHQGKFELSLDMATNVVDGWDGRSASEAMARLAEHPVSASYSWASLATWCLGRTDESLELAARAVAVGEEHLYALSTARVQRAFLHQLRREPDECRRWADGARELALAQGFPMRAVQSEMLLGWVDAMVGDPLGAERIRTALTAFQATGARLSKPYFLGLLAEAELLHGRPDDAVAIAADGLREMTRGSRTFFAAPELHRIEAKALAMCGRDDEAREHIDAAVRLAQELRSPVLELRALVEVVRAGIGGTPSRTRLAELAEQITGDGASDDLVEARTLVARSP
ncbi:MAG TPA: hypothetical protein VMQ81_09410, partial [Acidimicrobiia bacterium]|nr:hypothetical protein [Acidimicrobiia bacterium]